MVPPVISLQNVHKVYGSGEQSYEALKGVDVAIEKGELVAIIGPSGSGKSTLMNIIGTLDMPSSGTYRLNGKRIDQLNDKDMASIRNRHIGFVFQSFNLLPRISVLKNIERPMLYAGINPVERRARAMAILELVGLADKADSSPLNISGGQQQRIAIARALVMKPSLILADEPTGNLDSATATLIMEELVKVNAQGSTIVIVTHDPVVAGYAKRVIRVKDGRIEDKN